MTRLNNRIRDVIIKNAIDKSGITEAFEMLKQRRINWAESVRVEAIGGAGVVANLENIKSRISKAMKEVPDSVSVNQSNIRQDYDIMLNIAGKRFYAFFSGQLSAHPRSTQIYKDTPHDYTLERGNPLVDEFEALESEREDLEAKQDALRANVYATVYKFGSIKKLQEAWPEVVELLPKDLSPPKPNLPAILVKDLNSMIGLPTGEAA